MNQAITHQTLLSINNNVRRASIFLRKYKKEECNQAK